MFSDNVVIMPYGQQLGFPPDDLWYQGMELHFNHTFLEFEMYETPWPSADEDKHFGYPDRTLYHFGNTCPLVLGDGAPQCKAYKHKCYSCTSFVCEEFARNYLAKHAFDRGHHPKHVQTSRRPSMRRKRQSL